MGQEQGWNSPAVLSGFLGAPIFLALLIRRELAEKHPVLELGLFAEKNFGLGNAAMFVVLLALGGSMFILPFYLEMIVGLSPSRLH